MMDLDFMVYCDPQTSGGLLFTVNEENIHPFEEWCKQKGINIPCIGKVLTNTALQLAPIHFI